MKYAIIYTCMYMYVYFVSGLFCTPSTDNKWVIYIYIYIGISIYIYGLLPTCVQIFRICIIYIYKHILYHHPGNISNILSAKFLVHGWVTRCDFFKALFLGPATRVMGPHPRYVSFPQDGPLLYGCCKWTYGTPYKWGKINGYLGLFHPYKWPSVPVRSVRSVLGWLQGTSKKLLVMLGSLQEMSAAKALKIGTGIWMDFGWIWGPKIMVKSHDFGDTSQCLADPKKSLRRLNCLNSCQRLRRKKWKVRVEWPKINKKGYPFTVELAL